MPFRVSLLLVLVVLLALGGIVYLMASGREAADGGAWDPFARTTPDAEEAPLAPPLEAPPALAGSPRRAEARPRGPRWPVIPSDKIPRGELEVLPVGEDDAVLPAKDVSVRLEREGAEFSSPPLGRPDYETGTWTFDRVTIGWVKVIVFGDHLLETTARAEVRQGRKTEVKVQVPPAGAIRYKARLYSGEAPESVTLALLARGTKRPEPVYWQVRLSTAHTSAHKAASVTQGPEGIAFAIPPGAWTLRAESPAGELDLVDVDVEAGVTQDVEIQLRR